MTFATDESSVASSQPIELYQFTTPAKMYFLTSWQSNFTWNGQLYTAAASLTRNNLIVPEISDKRDLVIEIALTEALAQDLLVGGIPQRDVQVLLYRYQQVSGTVYGPMWAGFVAKIDTDGITVKLTVPSRLSEFVDRVQLPIAQVSRLCQHALYDFGCGIQQTGVWTGGGPGGSFQGITTVASVPNASAGIYNLTSVTGLQGNGTSPTTPLLYGFVKRQADNEVKSIIAQSTTTIQTDTPFRTLNPGDVVIVNVGCDRTPQTCRDKFANVPNFDGHPYLVPNNPQLPSSFGIIVSTGQP